MVRTAHVRSIHKQKAISSNIAVTAWRVAAIQNGFLLKGHFVHLPKKDTAEYAAILETRNKLVEEWNKLGEIPAEYHSRILSPEEQAVEREIQKKRQAEKRAEKRAAEAAKKAESGEMEVDQSSTEPKEPKPKKPRAPRVKKTPEEKKPDEAENVADGEAKPKKKRAPRKKKTEAETQTDTPAADVATEATTAEPEHTPATDAPAPETKKRKRAPAKKKEPAAADDKPKKPRKPRAKKQKTEEVAAAAEPAEQFKPVDAEAKADFLNTMPALEPSEPAVKSESE